MSKFKFGDKVRYNIFSGRYVGIGIYLGYDEEEQKHIIGCYEKREETKLQWALYADVADDDLELLERPKVGLNELNNPSRPVQRLEDLLEEL